MRDVFPQISRWMEAGEPVALATVIETWGSSPRKPGAKMAFTPAGKIAGSVSGGCVEAAVYEAGLETLKTGRPQLLRFGVADETAWEVGLACGGKIAVFVERFDPRLFRLWEDSLQGNRPFAVATVVSGPEGLVGRVGWVQAGEMNGWVPGDVAGAIFEKSRQAFAEGRSRTFDVTWQGQSMQVFVEVSKPPPTLVLVGGVHIAIALTGIARQLGFQTVVVDPRRAFGAAERFPHADRLIQAWPEEAFGQIELTGETAVAMLTHDPKIDDPALKIALQSPAFYVGALGSRLTQEKRRRRLQEAGLTAEQLDRLHGPIGLAIGGETPEEIALAIMAEVVAAYRAGRPAESAAAS